MASGLELRKRSSFLVPYICSFMLWETPTKFIELLILCTSNCLNCFKSVIVLIVLSQFSTFQIDWGKISLMQRLLCHDKKNHLSHFFKLNVYLDVFDPIPVGFVCWLVFCFYSRPVWIILTSNWEPHVNNKAYVEIFNCSTAICFYFDFDHNLIIRKD